MVGFSHNTTQQVVVYCTPTPKQCLCWCLKLLFILGDKGDKVKCTFFFLFLLTGLWLVPHSVMLQVTMAHS